MNNITKNISQSEIIKVNAETFGCSIKLFNDIKHILIEDRIMELEFIIIVEHNLFAITYG